MNSFEQMPLPIDDGRFAEWLVPARNNIQHQLLSLQKIVGPPDKKAPPPTDQEKQNWHIIGLLIGAAFSLWRAVFQAGNKPV
jgi:hypothetical protein